MRIPIYNSTCDVYTGAADSPPNVRIFTNMACEIYETAITRRGGQISPQGLATWTMLTATVYRPQDGYNALQDIWYPNVSNRVEHINTLSPDQRFYVRGWGVRWLGTPASHYRWYLVPFSTVPPTITAPALPPDLHGVPVTFDCYRPFSSGTPLFTNKSGILYPDLVQGRGGYSGGQYSTWTHFLDFDSSLDVRDASSRAAGLDFLSYADGDKIVVPSGGTVTAYVVMRVITYSDAGGVIIKRAYLVRDQPKWPGP